MVVKSSYRLISLISSVIIGGWPLSAAGVGCDSAAAGEVTDKPEVLLQSRRSGKGEGDWTEVDEERIEVIPSVGYALGA